MRLRWMRLLTGRVICSCLFAIIRAVAGEILPDLWFPEVLRSIYPAVFMLSG